MILLRRAGLCANWRSLSRHFSHNGGFRHRRAARQAAGQQASSRDTKKSSLRPVIANEQDRRLQAPHDEEEEQFLAPYMNACIKVYATHCEPNYSLPWQRKRQVTSTSSGFIATYQDKTYLLTNAHSVDYYTQVKVKRRGDDRKFLAKVVSIGVDCDIAMLDVEDEDFWTDVRALEFGVLPRLQDSVAVVGYPIGGDTISVTAGVVSRIEVTDYSHGSSDLLAIQIDAAINGGNSGGPVFNGSGQCVGIAFQALVGDDVENVGYVIPTPVVHHFLNDYIRTGRFTGFPALGIQWQKMESDALRRSYKMAASQKGILVRNINPTSHAASVLKPDDVIMKFDGVDISNDGTVPFRTGERIAFSYLISNKYIGDECSLDIWRGGEKVSCSLKLSKPEQLIPPHIGNADPSYFIVAGLVFSVCTEPYLQSEYGNDYGTQSPVKLLDKLYYGFPMTGDEELVILAQVLACDATLGYEDIYSVQLLRFNGQPVKNLRHLAEMVQGCKEKYCRFDLEFNELVIIETEKIQHATWDVMLSHSVPNAMSADLRSVGLGPWPSDPVENGFKH
ncbi:hypothetical protein CEUSTIGMA_g9645.t1 [Chlamydomonas eustigma]|uniref:Protease Do-like PDZ domain-containing protein n=1 Tax=Chlamydomonas eustigma TaxID=1157962 RepID=A0A250XGL9_9CHLO|nr:hypothetical protein CEUSTIGMA_g9645.t1 [Chlamydomonas eustigma]|eukprot:GAX82217.1 hypothetical protein CEUSTIGMA_g9645.t1 [Chlamydomonas eustigma]